ncbi:MAG TPA: DUF4397 domain-containing protein, partial [Flavobacterium sp.]|nr:DUF4397 domain-containing protein [Flavobacterium sp.]
MKKTTLLTIALLLSQIQYVWCQTTGAANARVQFIHNAPDAALTEIDIYLNGKLVADNFRFRTSSTYVTAPAGSVTIDVANASSTAASQRFYSLNTTFTEGSSHVVVADGVESTIALRPGFPFTLFVFTPVREEASILTNTDIFVYRSFDNSPFMDIIVPSIPGEVVTNDAFYRAGASGYIEAPAIDHTVQVRNQNNALVTSYVAPFRTLGLQGRSVVLLGSGFVQQLPDRNDPEFGLFMAVADGGSFIPLPLIPGNVFTFAQANILMHPNPANQFLRFEFPFAVRRISAQIIDNAGVTVRVVEDFGNRIDVSDLPEGMYTINLAI